jgi:hypothetical protein
MFPRFIAATAAIIANLGILNPVLAQVSFSSIGDGTLEQPPGQMQVLKSTVPAELMVTVDPNTSATIQVFPPSLISGSEPSGTTRSASITFGGTTLDSSSSAIAPLPEGNTNIEVNMQVQGAAPFSPGIYQYQVLLNITPN